MRKKRVLVLMHKDLVPPDQATKKERDKAPWKTEYDVVQTLKEKNHDVQALGVISSLSRIRDALSEFDPHIVFNLMEEFDGEAIFDQNVVSYLQLRRVPFTGCGPRGLMLSRDKAISKAVLGHHRIPVPSYQVVRKGRKFKLKKNLHYPLIVKSLFEESSMGIAQASVVYEEGKLKERVEFIHESIGTDAIIEEYIDGKEVYVGVIGNQRTRVLPPWELVFKKPGDNMELIATERVKFSEDYRKKYGITTRGLDQRQTALLEKIYKLSKRIYKLLYLSGYARLDFRIGPNDTPYLLEANPNPDIARDEDFASSAWEAGIDFSTLLEKIIQLGIQRG